MATAAQRKKARELRRIGMPIHTIAQAIGVPRSTAGKWLVDLKVTPRRKITAEIEHDVLEMRRDGAPYSEIARCVEGMHGVSVLPKTIGVVCRRAGLGGDMRGLGPDALAKVRKALIQSKSVASAAKNHGISERMARRIRRDSIAKGGRKLRKEYSEVTIARCVRIASRCGSSRRAAKMVRAVAGRGPSHQTIARWVRGSR